MEQKEVLVIGGVIVDYQIRPVPRDLMDRKYNIVESNVFNVGGDCINEATVITHLGHSATLMTMIGNDMIGSIILKHCQDNGIDTDAIRVRDDMETSINNILYDENNKIACLIKESGSYREISREDLDLNHLDKGYKVLSFASINAHPELDGKPLIEIFSKAKEQGMLISVDMKGGVFDNSATFEDTKKALSYVDYFFPNYQEACALTGKTGLDEVAEELLNWGIKNVIIKTGGDGCMLKNRQEKHVIPAYTKAKFVDEVGAGDNFAAGFICAVLEGKSFLECGQFATAVASIAVESVGAATGVKSREQADQRLSEYLEFIAE